MDESKPSISPRKFRLRSASEWTSADIDPPPAELAKSAELVAVERQNHSGQIEVDGIFCVHPQRRGAVY
jgi:hypothetical protein